MRVITPCCRPVKDSFVEGDVVNGTIGFQALASATGLMEKSLMRMLSVKGNPQARNLFSIIYALQQLNEVNLVITASPGTQSVKKVSEPF